MNWPGAKTLQDRLDCWKAMEEAVLEGKVRSIGVSNFLPRHIDSILKVCRIRPVVNQIELHSFYIDKETIDYCKKESIVIEAYSPLAVGKKELLQHHYVKELAEKYDKTSAQILIRWVVQQGFVVVVKTAKEERIRENANMWDFELAQEEVEELCGLNRMQKVYQDPHKVE